jgi:hypothetical protein
VLAAVGLSEAIAGQVQEWGSGLLLNAGCGLLTIAVVSLLMRFYQLPEQAYPPLDFRKSGIRRLVQDWVPSGKPSPELLEELFTQADTVEVAGVTLFNSFIGADWFAKRLANRIRDPEKTTRLLMLDPDGTEIRRREAERTGRTIKSRAESSRSKIREALAQSGVSDTAHSQFVRHFDYAPSVNWLRFGDTAYVVLLMYGRGGLSPAVELESDGWLFKKFAQQFASMWDEALKR